MRTKVLLFLLGFLSTSCAVKLNEALVESSVPDTTSPTIVNVISTNVDGGYGTGEVITVDIAFSEIVVVTGTPSLLLEMGTTDRRAIYVSGSGTPTLKFIYTLVSGDTNSDLDYVSSTSLHLNGGTIVDASSNRAILTLPAVGTVGSISDNQSVVICAGATSHTLLGALWVILQGQSRIPILEAQFLELNIREA